MWFLFALDDLEAWIYKRMFGRWMYRDFRHMRTRIQTPAPAGNPPAEAV